MSDVVTHSAPANFAKLLHATRSDKPLALGMDLGTNCGISFTYFDPGQPFDPTAQPIYVGMWDLSAGSYDSGAIRFVKLRQFLTVLNPTLILYEMIRHTPSEKITKFNAAGLLARAATAAELLGGFRAVVAEWAEAHHVATTGIPIGTIKKRATGKGNCGKPAMVKAAAKLLEIDLGETDEASLATSGADNVADALFCLICGLETLGQGVVGKALPDSEQKRVCTGCDGSGIGTGPPECRPCRRCDGTGAK